MDPEKSQPAPVVVPRAHGDIIIRQFQPRDTAQVHAMLYEGLIYGPESPRNTALRRNLTSRISCACYATFLLGAGCVGLSQHTHTTSTALTRTILKLGGGALCLGATLLFAYVRRTITGVFMHFCNTACRTDMADITASYEIPAEGEEVKQGPAGFWVAVVEAPDGKEEEEVVGYLGLGASIAMLDSAFCCSI
ncbi:hypothetical protein C8R43DRAFT_1044223 [Mycena crocata]|nr:hypothetical protein C8R43DRAFT_1044223 [Mycena crocata]